MSNARFPLLLNVWCISFGRVDQSNFGQFLFFLAVTTLTQLEKARLSG